MRKTVRWWIVAAFVAAAIVWVSLTVATVALAAGEGERVGENVGRLLGGWARNLYVGVAAVVAMIFLLNRRFADLAVFLRRGDVGRRVRAGARRGRRHDPRHLAHDHGVSRDAASALTQ